MKKVFLAFSFLAPSILLHAQLIDSTAAKRIRTAADLKTGNSQDVLISFFQLALNDLTGKEKTFKFQSSLFALKAKTDPSLFVDTNFLRQTASRNFAFSIAPSLDSNFRFKNNTIAVKYALVNNRDKAIFDFALPTEKEWNKIHTGALKEYALTFPDGVVNAKYKLAKNFFLDVEEDEDGNKRTKPADLPQDFKAILQKHLNNSNSFRLSSFENFRDTLAGEYAALARYVENRALWTIEASGAHDRNGMFSNAGFSSEYLKGLMPGNEKMNLELNLKASFHFDDDTSSKTALGLHRQFLAFSGGFNWIITRNRKSQSIVELKGAIVYNHITSGLYAGEERQKFTAEGTFRIRISNDIWVPLDIKYDPTHGNVFGFLSIRSNFDWLKSRIKS